MAILGRKILKTIFASAERRPSPMTGAILKQSEPNYQLFTGTASPHGYTNLTPAKTHIVADLKLWTFNWSAISDTFPRRRHSVMLGEQSMIWFRYACAGS